MAKLLYRKVVRSIFRFPSKSWKRSLRCLYSILCVCKISDASVFLKSLLFGINDVSISKSQSKQYALGLVTLICLSSDSINPLVSDGSCTKLYSFAKRFSALKNMLCLYGKLFCIDTSAFTPSPASPRLLWNLYIHECVHSNRTRDLFISCSKDRILFSRTACILYNHFLNLDFLSLPVLNPEEIRLDPHIYSEVVETGNLGSLLLLLKSDLICAHQAFFQSLLGKLSSLSVSIEGIHEDSFRSLSESCTSSEIERFVNVCIFKNMGGDAFFALLQTLVNDGNRLLLKQWLSRNYESPLLKCLTIHSAVKWSSFCVGSIWSIPAKPRTMHKASRLAFRLVAHSNPDYQKLGYLICSLTAEYFCAEDLKRLLKRIHKPLPTFFPWELDVLVAEDPAGTTTQNQDLDGDCGDDFMLMMDQKIAPIFGAKKEAALLQAISQRLQKALNISVKSRSSFDSQTFLLIPNDRIALRKLHVQDMEEAISIVDSLDNQGTLVNVMVHLHDTLSLEEVAKIFRHLSSRIDTAELFIKILGLRPSFLSILARGFMESQVASLSKVQLCRLSHACTIACFQLHRDDSCLLRSILDGFLKPAPPLGNLSLLAYFLERMPEYVPFHRRREMYSSFFLPQFLSQFSEA
jgi:hypothetical protein